MCECFRRRRGDVTAGDDAVVDSDCSRGSRTRQHLHCFLASPRAVMWRWRTVLVLLWLLYDSALALQSFVRQPSDQYVKQGQTVVLPCQVSDQVGQVQWTRDEFGLGIIRDLPSYPRYQMIGDDQEGIYSLEIQRATLEDDAVFQCQVGSAAGHQGIRSRDARLTILVPPEPPRVIQGDQVTTTAGLVVRLQCESRGGKPPAEIEWYRGDGSMIENVTSESVLMSDGKRSVVRSTLLLPAAAQHHDTSLTCRAHNAALTGPQTAAVRLRVTFPPQVTVTPDHETVEEFEDVTLHCRATANPAQVRYRWLVNGEVLPGQTASSATLRAVGRHLNNASVACQVTNDVGTGSDEFRLSVLYAPRFREEPSDLAAEAGQQATLTCAVDANPPPEVTWIRRECRSCPQPVGVGRSLTLVASEDTVGLYECRTSSERHPSVSRRLRLFVRAAPRVTAPATQHGTPGQLVHLECTAASVPPPSAVTWLFNNQPVPLDTGRRAVVEESVVGGVRSLLVIPDATEADFGLYNCSVTNAYGSHSALIILEREKDLPVLIILTVVIGAIIVITTVTLVVIMCQRHHRRSKDVPSEPVTFDKGSRATDANSSGSDLKVEIRTSSSGSGQVITDRWDSAHYPGHRPLYDQHSDERAFPPFDKEMTQNGTAIYPPYDQNGYLQKSSTHQRVLHASTPIEFGSPPPEGDAPPHTYYPHEGGAPQPVYYPKETGVPPRGPPTNYPSQTSLPQGYSGLEPGLKPQPGYYSESTLSPRPSYYAQDVSDGSSSSQTRLSGPTYEEPAGSAPGGRSGYYGSDEPPTSAASGRSGYYTSEEAPGRPQGSLGRAAGRSRGRAVHQDRYAEPTRLAYGSDAPLKPGMMATPV